MDKITLSNKCKSCQRSLTQYTGIWMARHHREDKGIGYLKLIDEKKRLDKIVSALGFNKKTAFNWRHKMWASLGANDGDDFTYIA